LRGRGCSGLDAKALCNLLELGVLVDHRLELGHSLGDGGLEIVKLIDH
jgi:hypothetical protein